jgi:hypothetical protein
MNDLASFGSLAQGPMSCPSKAANSQHIYSDHSKSRFPYSSTKLGFVNNPG